MKHSRVLAMMTLAAMGCATLCEISTPSPAQAAPKAAKVAAEDKIDKDFWPFWAKFKEALSKNDKNALADMTKLPYLDMIDDKKLDRAGFIGRSEKIFSPSRRKGLPRQKPVADKDSIMVFYDDDIFIFVKEQGQYKFTEIGVND